MTAFPRLLTLPALALGLCLALGAPALPGWADSATAALKTAVVASDLPEKKLNTTGLYVTAAEAIAALAAREDFLLVDVRSPEEAMFVGYATPTDALVPFKLVNPAHPYNAKKQIFGMMDNPDFVPQMQAFLADKHPAAVLVMCRSGSRSAAAVDALVTVGVTAPLYTVVDGFEGDTADTGARSVNGWKNAGGNWTYKIRADLMPQAAASN
jgi:rhodanese-related sulfurtransferase